MNRQADGRLDGVQWHMEVEGHQGSTINTTDDLTTKIAAASIAR
jgi:hypothetical protein